MSTFDDNYIFILSPEALYDLTHFESPKAEYRYNRWRERYMRRYSVDPEMKGEVGTL